jgi:hypothetical protein
MMELKLSNQQLDKFEKWIETYIEQCLESVQNENEEDREEIKDMHLEDKEDLLLILKDIKRSKGKSAYELWSSMDTNVREMVPDYIADYLEPFGNGDDD